MKISILLPYKENYSQEYAGAVSIYINSLNKHSIYKKNIKVFGSTTFKSYLSKNYTNINLKKNLLQSSSKIYLNNFIKIEQKRKSDIIEIHNRPSYLKYLKKLVNRKFVIYFHNDPLLMNGSVSINDRLSILNFCHKIIFNSRWTKERFFDGLDKFYFNSPKTQVIYQSTSKTKVNLKSKKKIITFIGKLNSSKGYDLFGNAVIKILNENKDWKAYVFGDEHREKINFNHKRLIKLGYRSNKEVLKTLKKTSIAVVCSRWEEPFGRSSLEASSRGCAVILSNRGGLPETTTDGIIINKLNSLEIYKSIKKLIINPSKLLQIQKSSLKNFYLTNKYISKYVDDYRSKLFNKKILKKKNKLKILHVTNFNERHNGRLFFNTGGRINNGFLNLNHTVITLSDRDVISNEKKLIDPTGSKSLNNKLIDIVGNFIPDLIIFGHADQISNDSVKKVKDFYPDIKFGQWFLDKMDNDYWTINKNRFKQKLELMDANFCTTHPSSIKEFKNKKVYFIPNPVDDKFDNLKIYQNKNFKYDLFFAISHGVHRGVLKKGKSDDREKFIKKIYGSNSEIRCNIFGINNKQPIWAEEFKENLSISKMALNLSQGKASKFYSSDRIAQLIGNGILTFINNDTRLYKIFKKNEVVFYSDHKDLYEKIIYFKKNDLKRIKIAKNGRNKYHKFMNSKTITSYMINKIFNSKSDKNYFWTNK